MKYFVHIGVNKTGTSSLQKAFDRNRAALEERGIAYPDLWLDTSAHHNISRLMKGRAPEGSTVGSDWQAEAKAALGGFKTCVFSSEDFATVSDPSPLAAVCPPGQTTIVMYVREHVAHTSSWYQQTIQSLNTARSLSEFAQQYVVSYRQIFENWAKVYGADNVVLRLYDRKALVAGDIVTDFAELVQPGLGKLFAGERYDANPSLAGNLLFIKRILNAFITQEESKDIIFETTAMAAAAEEFSGKMPVDERTVRQIAFLAREDRRWLSEVKGIQVTPPTGPIEGAPSPDLACLPTDFAKLMDFAVSRNMKSADLMRRIEAMVGAAPGVPYPPLHTAGTAPNDVAQGLLWLKDEERFRDPEALREAWLEQRPAVLREARKLIHRLERMGYVLHKSPD